MHWARASLDQGAPTLHARERRVFHQMPVWNGGTNRATNSCRHCACFAPQRPLKYCHFMLPIASLAEIRCHCIYDVRELLYVGLFHTKALNSETSGIFSSHDHILALTKSRSLIIILHRFVYTAYALSLMSSSRRGQSVDHLFKLWSMQRQL
jgi:hypothetical protein